MLPPMASRSGDFSDDEDRKSDSHLGTKRKFEEFECPACSAHNPFDTFGDGDEVNCNWCGVAWVAQVNEDGALRLREA